jgi:hypothetical protein
MVVAQPVRGVLQSANGCSAARSADPIAETLRTRKTQSGNAKLRIIPKRQNLFDCAPRRLLAQPILRTSAITNLTSKIAISVKL